MLKTINYNDTKFKYHAKIRKNLLTKLKFLPKDFWQSNPIVSGSYAIHLLFKPSSFYDDIDLYFESEANYNLAKEILKGLSQEKSSKNSNTFIVNENKIQLINKFFAPPEEIVYMHDFKNSSICITQDNIYLDDELFELYYNDKLSIRNTQIVDTMNKTEKMKKIGLLFDRVLKYEDRYELSLDQASLDTLLELKIFLENIPKNKLDQVVIDSSIYYNGTHSPCQNNLRTMSEIKRHFDNFLLKYTYSSSTDSPF